MSGACLLHEVFLERNPASVANRIMDILFWPGSNRRRVGFRESSRPLIALGEAYEHDIFYLAYGHGAADHRRTRLADPSGLEALTLKRAAINSASSHIAVAKSARTSLGMLGASRRERSAVENRALRGPISTGFVPARCPYRQRLLNRPVYRPVFHSMTIGRRSIFLKQRLGRKG